MSLRTHSQSQPVPSPCGEAEHTGYTVYDCQCLHVLPKLKVPVSDLTRISSLRNLPLRTWQSPLFSPSVIFTLL